MKNLNILSLLVFITLLISCNNSVMETKTQIIAHRGYWDTEGSAQNSIAALQKAAEIGVYGSEFDVNVTSDGIPIINHDGDIQGMRIEEHPFIDFADYTLSNGEKLPTLEEYLIEGAKYPEMKLILEIKSASTPEKESIATNIIMDMVERMKLQSQVEYIAFSLHIVKEIVKRAPTVKVAYLNGDLSPRELKEMGINGLDYHYSVFANNENWIEEAKESGVSINVWTVNSSELIENMILQKVDFITTDNPLLVAELL